MIGTVERVRFPSRFEARTRARRAIGVVALRRHHRALGFSPGDGLAENVLLRSIFVGRDCSC